MVSNFESFRGALQDARDAGERSFMHNGKVYTNEVTKNGIAFYRGTDSIYRGKKMKKNTKSGKKKKCRRTKTGKPQRRSRKTGRCHTFK